MVVVENIGYLMKYFRVKKYYNIDKFYKLKQNIDSIKNFITVEEQYAYIHLNLESKQYLISLFDLADQVNDILLNNPHKTYNA